VKLGFTQILLNKVMLERFKRKFDIKKQSISPLRKPPRIGGKQMKAGARLAKKPKGEK